MDLNGGAGGDPFSKGPSLGLVVLKARHPSNETVINNFYNPQQSTAARKFFKKQKQVLFIMLFLPALNFPR